MTDTPSTTKIQTGTAEGLLEFFDFLTAKGYATPAAVTPLKSATRQVLSTVEGGDFGSVDVRQIDPDPYLDRFENLVVGQYKQESVQAYRNRFRRGLTAYLGYLGNKELPSFGPSRKRSADRPAPKPGPAHKVPSGAEPAIPPSAAERLIDYPFPLRNGQIAILRLPVRMERADAERMGAYVRTLVFDQQRELTEGQPDGAPK